MGKLISLIIFGVLGYQNQVMVVKNIQYLIHVTPIMQTYMEITSYKSKLIAYTVDNNGRLPENLGEWLNQNFKSVQKRDMSVDYFATPYQVALDKDTSKETLISCGPDKECGTGDDIVLEM